MKPLTILGALAAALLFVPGTAHAAKPAQSGEAVSVVSGVLTYTSGAGTVDTVGLASTMSGTILSETTSPTGAIGTGCSALTSTSAYCLGATSASVQTLDLDDSIINGSNLPGTFDAGAGDDTLTGGDAGETLRGGDGADVVSGGGGSDVVDGGLGDDQISVRDGVADTVDCGDGNDAVEADVSDAVTGCEVVATPVDGATGSGTRTPGETQTGSDPTDPLSAPALLAPITVIGPVTARVKDGTAVEVGSNGRAPLLLGCDADAASACAGTVFIDPASSKGGKRGHAKRAARAFMARRGRFGASSFRIDPGAESNLQIKLTTLAMRALGKPVGRKARASRRGRRVRAVVTIAPKTARAQRVKIVLAG